MLPWWQLRARWVRLSVAEAGCLTTVAPITLECSKNLLRPLKCGAEIVKTVATLRDNKARARLGCICAVCKRFS